MIPDRLDLVERNHIEQTLHVEVQPELAMALVAAWSEAELVKLPPQAAKSCLAETYPSAFPVTSLAVVVLIEACL